MKRRFDLLIIIVLAILTFLLLPIMYVFRKYLNLDSYPEDIYELKDYIDKIEKEKEKSN